MGIGSVWNNLLSICSSSAAPTHADIKQYMYFMIIEMSIGTSTNSIPFMFLLTILLKHAHALYQQQIWRLLLLCRFLILRVLRYSRVMFSDSPVNLQINLDKAASKPIVQWNLSVTTTFIIKYVTCDLFSNVCFNEDWRYQFTLASNVCLLELI